MSGEEAGAHRASGTIVRNSGVFRDRSARCAAASRSFLPRGLLWRFLRKFERKSEKRFFVRNAGQRLRSARPCGGPPRAEASARAAQKRRSLAQTKSLQLFLVLLDQAKSTKRSSTAKSCGCRRRRSLSGHERLRCLRCKKTCRFDCGGSAKSASGLCARLWPSFSHPLRAFAPSPPLSPHFSQCGRASLRPAGNSRSRRKGQPIYGIVRSCVLYSSAGLRPA